MSRWVCCIVCCALLLGARVGFNAELQGVEIAVPASHWWTDTGIDVKRGDCVSVRASGQVRVSKKRWSYFREIWFGRGNYDYRVGPKGTYNFEPLEVLIKKYRLRGYLEAHRRIFPIPTAYWGPYPAYGLIGKIGEDGKAFYVGEESLFSAGEEGRLFLGINDFEVRDNRGEWKATIVANEEEVAKSDRVQDRRHIQSGGELGRRGDQRVQTASKRTYPNSAKSNVFVIYVDGLRCDVVDEMVRWGFLPNIRDIFYANGCQIESAFSVFPSNTVASNATMWTGLYANHTGIKDQVVLERGFADTTKNREIDRLTKFSPERTNRTLHRQGVRTVFDYTKGECGTSILLISWFSPPQGWMEEAANVATTFFSASVSVVRNIDRANFTHAISLIHDPEVRLIVLWLPGVDETGHRTPYGQFGAARKLIWEVDQMIGRLRWELQAAGKWDDTVMILTADHPHVGGERDEAGEVRLNHVWDIAGEFFLPRGFNVRHMFHRWTLPKRNASESYAYIADGGGTGVLNVYLPYQGRDSGDWSTRNEPKDLLAYRLGGKMSVPCNVFKVLMQQRVDAAGCRLAAGMSDQPVAFILAKCDEKRFLIYKSETCQAVVTREGGMVGEESRFQYLPVRDFRYNAEKAAYEYEENWEDDPLGYMHDAGVARQVAERGVELREFLREYHSEETWLRVTGETEYPFAPVLMGHYFFNAPNVTEDLRNAEPDMVLVGNPGWLFVGHALDYPPLEGDSERFQGTTHGYPNRECMKIPLFFSGKHVRKGAITEEPRTLVNLTPTILWLLGHRVEEYGMGGQPCYEIVSEEQ